MESAHDLHKLLLGGREAFDAPICLERESVVLDESSRGRKHGRLVKKRSGDALATQKHVLGDREVRREQGFLVNHCDAGIVRVSRLQEVHFPALPAHGTAVAAVHSGDDLHHRGLARAVLADQSMNLAGVGVEFAAAERANAAEALLNVGEFEQHER